MEGFDYCVSPMPFRFRGNVVNQESGDQTAEGGSERDQPQTMWANPLLQDTAIAGKRGRPITAESNQEKVGARSQGPCKDLSGERADDPHEGGFG